MSEKKPVAAIDTHWQDQPIPELGGRSWAELEAARHDSGKLMFRDQLRRRGPDGSPEVTDVRVCVPSVQDHVQARVEAVAWFAKNAGLDRERDSELFDEVEQVCLLARCVRTAKAPHSQFADAEELGQYDEAALQDILGRLTVYKRLVDVREAVVTEDDFWLKVVAVAKAGHLLPLTDIAGHEQPSFIVRMAREACSSPTGRSWLQSSATSTPEGSP